MAPSRCFWSDDRNRWLQIVPASTPRVRDAMSFASADAMSIRRTPTAHPAPAVGNNQPRASEGVTADRVGTAFHDGETAERTQVDPPPPTLRCAKAPLRGSQCTICCGTHSLLMVQHDHPLPPSIVMMRKDQL